MSEIKVTIVEPDITPEENECIINKMRMLLMSIPYEDLLEIKEA